MGEGGPPGFPETSVVEFFGVPIAVDEDEGKIFYTLLALEHVK